MAPTLVATAGSGSANSYVTRANATTYLDARLNTTAWSPASDEDKDRALISATRALDPAPWIGFRATDTQALSWPRTYALKPDRPYDTGSDDIYFADDAVPQAVQDATCELALELLRAGTSDVLSTDRSAGVIRKKVDVIETEWEAGRVPTGLARFPNVLTHIARLFESTAGSLVIRRA